MHTRYRSIAPLLLLLAIFTLAGCGSTPVEDDNGNGSPTGGYTLYFDTDGLANNFVNDIAVDYFRNGVWVATQKGVSFLSFADSTWTTYGTASGFPNLQVTSLAVNLGTVWAGTISGPVSFTGSGWAELPDPGVLPNTFITAITSMPEPDYSLWFGTRGGVARRSATGQWTRFTVQDGLSYNDVTSITRDYVGNVWVATRNGLNVYDGSHWTIYASVLPNATVQAVYADSYGSIWAGTEYGAVEFRPEGRYSYGPADGLPSPVVTDFVEDFNRVLWIATDLGIAWFDGSFWHPLNLPAAVGGAPVTSLASDALTRSLWIGTAAGLVRYQASN